MLRALPLCTCCHHYPGAATGITLAHSPSRISLPRNGDRVGLRNVLFEACSVFTHVTACTLALPPNSRHASPEASTALLPPQLLRLLPAGAVAEWDFHPLGKRRLNTAHARSGHGKLSLNVTAKPNVWRFSCAIKALSQSQNKGGVHEARPRQLQALVRQRKRLL